jgi:hypothetical protein
MGIAPAAIDLELERNGLPVIQSVTLTASVAPALHPFPEATLGKGRKGRYAVVKATQPMHFGYGGWPSKRAVRALMLRCVDNPDAVAILRGP